MDVVWRKLTLITLCLFCGNTDTLLRFDVCTWRGLNLLAFTCCLRDVDGDAACDDYNDDDANNYHDCDVKTAGSEINFLIRAPAGDQG